MTDLALALTVSEPHSEYRLEALMASACNLSHPNDFLECLETCKSISQNAAFSKRKAHWQIECLAIEALMYLQQGNCQQWEEKWKEMGRLARRVRLPVYLWHYERLIKQNTFLDQPMNQALTAVSQMRDLAPKIHGQWAEIIHQAQVHWVMTEREHYDHLHNVDEGMLREKFEWVGPSLLAALAVTQAKVGKTDLARSSLASLTRDKLGRIPRNHEYLDVMAHLCDVTLQIRELDTARTLFEALTPYENCIVMTGLGLLRGSVAHYLGRIAVMLGEAHHAEKYLKTAIKLESTFSITPRLVQSRLALSGILESSEPEKALILRQTAQKEALIVDMNLEIFG
jgi:hypothetical protein